MNKDDDDDLPPYHQGPVTVLIVSDTETNDNALVRNSWNTQWNGSQSSSYPRKAMTDAGLEGCPRVISS